MIDIGDATDIIVRLRLEASGIKAGLQEMMSQVNALKQNAVGFGSAIGASARVAVGELASIATARSAQLNGFRELAQNVKTDIASITNEMKEASFRADPFKWFR